MLMMGLRLAEGDRPRPATRALAGAPLAGGRVAELARARAGRRADGRPAPRSTPAGRPLLDAVLRRLLEVSRLARQQLAEAVELLEGRVADADLAGLLARAVVDR